MQKRKLGNSGLEVSSLCLGGNVFGWTADENTSFQVLDAFVDGGANFIDTADTYSRWAPGNKGGESETIIGKWFKRSGKRDKVILATKVGMEMAPDKKGLSRKYILQEIEDSLSRLQTDYIDLYQSHTDDQETPLEEALGIYADLIKQGNPGNRRFELRCLAPLRSAAREQRAQSAPLRESAASLQSVRSQRL